VDDLTQTAFLRRPDLHVGTEGEFAGWRTWSRDNFETHNGPFWHRMEADGRIRSAFRVEKKHLNGAGNVLQCPKGKVKRSGKCVARKSKKHKQKQHKKSSKRHAKVNRGGK